MCRILLKVTFVISLFASVNLNAGKIKIYQKECSNGSKESCFYLGKAYLFGRYGVDKDRKQGLSLIKKSCDMGFGSGCFFAGRFDRKNSLFFYKKGCELKNAASCEQAGRKYYHKKRYKESLVFFKKSCELEYKNGCINLANLYRMGKGVEKSIQKASKMYQTLCDGDFNLQEGKTLFNGKSFPRACSQSGFLFHQQKNYAKSFKYHAKACRLDKKYCSGLATLYETGEGIKKDKKKALELYVQSCAARNKFGCYNAASMYEKAGKIVEAAQLYDKSTWYSYKSAKRKLEELLIKYKNIKKTTMTDQYPYTDKMIKIYTNLYKDIDKTQRVLNAKNNPSDSNTYDVAKMYEDGIGVAKDYREAMNLYKKICKNGFYKGCVSLGNFYLLGKGVKRDYAKATDLYRNSCDKGYKEGCYMLGKIYFLGKGVDEDYHKAKKLFEMACKSNVSEACYYAGKIYLHGYGVKKSSTNALNMFIQSCKQGYIGGCNASAKIYVRSEKLNKALGYYKISCDKKDSDGCFGEGYVYEKFGDKTKAKEYYSKSCKYGNPIACGKKRKLEN